LAFVAINITPVNDAPTAVNDSFSAVNGVAIALNVLANDIDPDGVADLATVQIVTPPVGATAVVGAGGVVTFTGASGSYTFTYRAVDQAGVVSGNVATATVVVANAETIAFVRSDFIGNKLRWRIDGTDTLHAGQTITVSFNNGTRANGTSLDRNGHRDRLRRSDRSVDHRSDRGLQRHPEREQRRALRHETESGQGDVVGECSRADQSDRAEVEPVATRRRQNARARMWPGRRPVPVLTPASCAASNRASGVRSSIGRSGDRGRTRSAPG
jgi:hypothetical protein